MRINIHTQVQTQTQITITIKIISLKSFKINHRNDIYNYYNSVLHLDCRIELARVIDRTRGAAGITLEISEHKRDSIWSHCTNHTKTFYND